MSSTYQAQKNLISAIFYRAIRDLDCSGIDYNSAIFFLQSDYAFGLAAWIDLDSSVLQRLVEDEMFRQDVIERMKGKWY